MSTAKLGSGGLYLVLAQSVAAIGQLVGLRLLTGELSPATFGSLNLVLGVSGLLTTGLVNPTMQAYLRFAPEYALRNLGACAHGAAVAQLKRLMVFALPVIALGELMALKDGWINLVELLLLDVLLWSEAMRTLGMAAFNAKHQHKQYGLWTALDTCAKPVLAWGLCFVLGGNLAVALLGYALAGVLVWAFMRRRLARDGECCPVAELQQLGTRFWAYTIPLLPLGLVGWISGMSDRYIIGSLLTLEDVGLYAAVYAIASKPMLVASNLIETLVRPAYMDAIVNGNTSRQSMLLKRWIATMTLASVAIIFVAILAHELIAEILVGAAFRAASVLIPWILGGYALLAISHAPARFLYAHDGTRWIFWCEVCSAITALLVGAWFIWRWGLMGAGYAVPCYFGLQLITASGFAIAKHHSSHQRATT